MQRHLHPALITVLAWLTLAGTGFAATVARPTFNKAHGFYTSSFSVTISSGTSGATIRYTTDGSKPTSSHGTALANGGSVSINTTTCLRAVGAKSGMTTSQPFTQTYIFLSKVLTQTRPTGYPTKWGTGDPWSYDGHADYDMDPDIVNNSSYESRIQNDLKSIPSLSIVGSVQDIFGNGSTWGVYGFGNGGGGENTLEKGVSLELITPSGEGFQIDCGLKPHSWQNPKRSLRLLFKSNYGGPAKLDDDFFTDAPLNSGSAIESFGKLILRGGMNDSFASGDSRNACNLRDEWGRNAQISMSGLGAHGTFRHLYINGLYWGVYNVCERPDARFCADYLGGGKSDWFAWNQGGDVSGNDNRFDYLIDTLGPKDQSSASNYSTIQQYLDIPQFADYVLLAWMLGYGDWQKSSGHHNNMYACNRNSSAGPTMYFCWDTEYSWDVTDTGGHLPDVNGAFRDGGYYQSTSGHKYVARLFRGLWKNSDFRILFADNAYKHLHNGGALTESNCKARLDAIANYVEDAMVGESARWGDQDGGTPRNLSDWRGARDRMRADMSGCVTRLESKMRGQTLNGIPFIPPMDPPKYSKYGGTVSSGYKLTLTKTSGTIYYRTDGQDPRVSGGAIRSGTSASSATKTISLISTSTVKARMRSGSTWSALASAKFTVTGGTPAIAVSTTGIAVSCEEGTDAPNATFQVWNSGLGTLLYKTVEATSTFSISPTTGSSTGSGNKKTHTIAFTTSGLAVGTHNKTISVQDNGSGASNGPITISVQITVTSAPQPPAAPGSMAASALSSSEIRVGWQDNSGNESGFKLDRRVSGASTWARVATPGANVTTYTDSGLADGTTFYYKVKEYNGDGDSGYSNTDDATTPVELQPPAAPGNPSATALSTSAIRFTWTDNSNDEESFKIRRSLDGSDWYTLSSITVSANTTSYTDTGLAADTKYWFKVRAANAAGDSAYTAAASATTQQATPSAPSNLAATALDSSRIAVSWQDNSGSEDGYKLDRRQSGASTWQRPATLAANATSYTDTGLPADTTFYYKVKAYNAGGNSDYSNVDGAKTQLEPTPAIAVSTTSIAVSCEEGTDAADTTFEVWNSDAATLAYNVLEGSSKLDVSPTSGTSTGSADKQTHTVIFHTADLAVGIHNRSINIEDDGSGAANGPITIAVEITVTARPLDPPAAPSAMAATALSASELAVSWQDNSDNESGFKLDRRQTMTDAWVRVGTLAADVTSYTDSGLLADTTFYYKVKAYNADGDSAYSAVAGAKTEPEPTPAIAVSTTSIAVSCEQGTDAADTTFQVWNSDAATLAYNVVEGSSKLDVTPTTGTSTGSADKQTHTITFHTAGLAVGVYDRSINVEDDGSGAPNGPITVAVQISVTAPAVQPPSAPSNLAATALSSSEIRVSWQDNSTDEDGFKIDRRRSMTDVWVRIGTPGADVTQFTDAGLSPETKYYYKVMAHNAGGDSAYSLVAFAITAAAAPAAPFAAYNDLAWAEGQRSLNITTYTRGEGGALKNYADGATLGATLTLNMGGDFTGPTMGAEPAAGTDAANVFGGIVDCLGLISYGATDLTLTFSGLDPALLYEVVVFGNRNKPDYTDRITKNAISGADAFVNASSSGTAFSGPSDTSTAVVNGYNTQNGHVARFIDVEPGTDGEFQILVYDNESPTKPKFYVSAVMLKAYELAQADSDGDGLSDGDEYVMGTSAANPDEYLAVRLGLVAGQLTASFDTIVADGAGYEGKTRYYALERCTDIASGTWTPVSGYDRIQATGQAQNCTLADPEAAAVFRARVWLE